MWFCGFCEINPIGALLSLLWSICQVLSSIFLQLQFHWHPNQWKPPQWISFLTWMVERMLCTFCFHLMDIHTLSTNLLLMALKIHFLSPRLLSTTLFNKVKEEHEGVTQSLVFILEPYFMKLWLPWVSFIRNFGLANFSCSPKCVKTNFLCPS